MSTTPQDAYRTALVNSWSPEFTSQDKGSILAEDHGTARNAADDLGVVSTGEAMGIRPGAEF